MPRSYPRVNVADAWESQGHRLRVGGLGVFITASSAGNHCPSPLPGSRPVALKLLHIDDRSLHDSVSLGYNPLPEKVRQAEFQAVDAIAPRKHLPRSRSSAINLRTGNHAPERHLLTTTQQKAKSSGARNLKAGDSQGGSGGTGGEKLKNKQRDGPDSSNLSLPPVPPEPPCEFRDTAPESLRYAHGRPLALCLAVVYLWFGR